MRDKVMKTAHGVGGSDALFPLRPRALGLGLLVLTVVAAALRVIGINRGLWWDEIDFLLVSVRHPLVEIVTIFPGDIQHTLYAILARLSILAFGEHVWSLRLPALIFGVASIPMLYVLGASVTTKVEALVASALLTVSYHHVWFSQNARGYTALAFWTMLSTYLLLRGIRTQRRGPFLWYAVAAALGVYTHLTMAFLVASHVLVCTGIALADWKKDTQCWKFPLQGFLATGVLCLVFYAPILLQVQNWFLKRPSGMRAVSTPLWAFAETLRGLILGLGTEGALAAAALVVSCGAWSYLKQSRLVFALFVLPGLVTALGAILARGTMYPRFYFFLIGFAVLILVRGVFVIPQWITARSPKFDRRLRPWLTAVLAGALLTGSAFSLVRNYRYPKQDYEGAVQFVDADRKDGDLVVTAGAAAVPLLQYYAKPWENVETAERLQEICGQGRVVWIVYTFPRYLAAWRPPLMEIIQNRFTVIRVFPGTLGDGAVFVGRFQSR
jgi:mannosyltransferase